MSEFQVAAFHDLVGISGSLILGLAVFDGFVSAETAWNLSRLDEEWQIEQWGQDDEAKEVAGQKYASMVNADTFLQLCD
jgi:chaperone required for assembly of F1-ATPase